jgi:hypothetical protein
MRPRIQRSQRGKVGHLDVELRAEVAQQGSRQDPKCVQRPPAHAHEADMQRQAKLHRPATPANDQVPLGT